MSPPHTPPGWPAAVRAPSTDDWEASALAYLFDCCPADFRAYRVLRNHPLVLAQFATEFVEGQCQSAQNGLASIRSRLRGRASAEAVDAAVEAWMEQGARLARTRRAVSLIDEALRGRVFVARM